MNQGKKIWK